MIYQWLTHILCLTLYDHFIYHCIQLTLHSFRLWHLLYWIYRGLLQLLYQTLKINVDLSIFPVDVFWPSFKQRSDANKTQDNLLCMLCSNSAC